MQKIVVGVDGSSGSAAALRWAGQLVAGRGGEVVAVHALRSPRSELPADDHDRLVAERRTMLEELWVKPAIEAGATTRSVIQDGDPRDLLASAADTEDATLVVVGRTGDARGPGFLHLGSVAEYLAHSISRPLAVIPADGTGPIHRIIVGVDGSRPSLTAFEWCVGVANAVDADVVAVAVDEPYLEWTPPSSPDNWRRDVERHAKAWIAPLMTGGVSVHVVAQRDLHPAHGLLETASDRGGDLIVVGTRGVGGFTGLRAGGVAMKVLHRATLPLVLVPVAS